MSKLTSEQKLLVIKLAAAAGAGSRVVETARDIASFLWGVDAPAIVAKPRGDSTTDRRDLIWKLWPSANSFADIKGAVNALPGKPLSSQEIRSIASKRSVLRPKELRDNPLKAAHDARRKKPAIVNPDDWTGEYLNEEGTGDDPGIDTR